jgi:hypothetical protein
MTAGSWVQRDRLRESWVFLLLGTSESELQHWECGVGNPDQLISTETEHLESGSVDTETELLAALLSHLQSYRYQDTVILTLSVETLQTLRRRMAAAETDVDSLRGFSHIPLETLLEQYFDQTLTDHQLSQTSLPTPRQTAGTDENNVVSTGAIQQFWEAWKQLYRLIPAAELRGTKL